MRAVTGAIPTIKIPSFTDRNTAKMRTNTNHYEVTGVDLPVWFRNKAFIIRLWVWAFGNVSALSLGDFFRRPVTHKDGGAAPEHF